MNQEIEAKYLYKTPVVASILNLILPSSGYLYCRMWWQAIVAFLACLNVARLIQGLDIFLLIYGSLLLIFCINGASSVVSYNIRIKDVLIADRMNI